MENAGRTAAWTDGEARDAKQRILAWAREVGLSAAGVAPAAVPRSGSFLLEWLRRGYAASMDYLARDPQGRIDPQRILEGCRSIVCVAMDYYHDEPPVEAAAGATDGAAAGAAAGAVAVDGGEPPARISRYAWGEDYHEILKEKLLALAERIHQAWPEERTRVAVDTSPVLERAFAAEAGLGWFGKHTNLISPQRGSWFFLGEIFTTLPLPRDAPVPDACGTCVRCLEVCPTRAFPEPYVLDASRCLSYWNIEHRGAIDPRFEEPMGEWIFGCDLCQEACPWNREPVRATEPRLAPRAANLGLPAAAWESLDEEGFRARFRGTAVRRARYDGLKRNIAIAAANARRTREAEMRTAQGPIRLYGAAWSPETRVARRFLDAHRVAYEYVEVDRDGAAAAELQQATGSRLIPVLRIGGDWVAAHARDRGFLFAEVAARLGIPAEEVPELRVKPPAGARP